MWNFYVKLYKSVLALYAGAVLCLSYNILKAEIPDQMYVQSGEAIEVSCSLPVRLSFFEEKVKKNGAAMSAAEVIRMQQPTKKLQANQDCQVMCYLFGFLPIQSIAVNVTEGTSVYVSGQMIGIYEKTRGVLVLQTTEVENKEHELVEPCARKIEAGDYITRINDRRIRHKEELVKAVQENKEKKMKLTLIRKDTEKEVTVTPVIGVEDRSLLGLWVKDDMAGIGTLSYYTKDGTFGALGHGISNGETGELLQADGGEIYSSALVGITKGKRGKPGELEGMIYYGNATHLGTVEKNTEIGIYGSLDDEEYCAWKQEDDCYEISYKQDIHTGQAYLISRISGELEFYEIKITEVSYDARETNKSMRIEVTDDRLIELTGGIVQGMSGSPIIQDGKLVGAVTHVLVNDPTRGYGIFIENMLEH